MLATPLTTLTKEEVYGLPVFHCREASRRAPRQIARLLGSWLWIFISLENRLLSGRSSDRSGSMSVSVGSFASWSSSHGLQSCTNSSSTSSPRDAPSLPYRQGLPRPQQRLPLRTRHSPLQQDWPPARAPPIPLISKSFFIFTGSRPGALPMGLSPHRTRWIKHWLATVGALPAVGWCGGG